MDVREALFSLQDLSYKTFHTRLIPTVDKETVIGVRTPDVRRLAHSLSPQDAAAFLDALPHRYYEENNVHACLIARSKDFDTAVSLSERFLPYINNWATCDMFFPKVFRKNHNAILPYIRKWMCDEKEYTVRFAIGLLMRLFLEEHFSPEYPSLVAKVPQEDYYVYMMVAWYFAEALIKQYDAVIMYLTEHRLPVRTHNKTIQKAIESFRIPAEIKSYLRTLRR